jgi:hypothetical protein
MRSRMQNDLKTETSAKRKHARIYNQLLPLLEGASNETVTWMPAHTATTDVGTKRGGEERLLTDIDRKTNGLADTHAKLAVAEHRVPEALRERAIKQAELIECVAT